ncbi:MAG: outer membrane protein assembly factor BamD [Thiotrichaceae bacterium]|nr:outer membrane protein assembly factor BamD [Thiotrichaceae bacterium]
MRPSNTVYCFIAAFSLLLSGCATTAQNSSSELPHENQHMTASTIYSSGKEAMNIGDNPAAIRHFNALITQFPTDKFALQGRLELAYAYHKTGQSSSTIATTERFINEHPQHKNSDYAYYLRGLSAYESAIRKLDAGATVIPFEVQMALTFLNELNNHYPDGKYSEDTRQRISALNERVAQRLVFSAKQQLDLGNPASAALLAKQVVDDYSTTSALQQAAIITNQAYQILGLNSSPPHNHAAAKMEPALVPTPVPSPVITATPGPKNLMASSKTIRDTHWLMSQGPQLFTIQVLGTENEALLRQQIKNGGLTNKVAYYKKNRGDIAWFSLVYGSYTSREAALTASQSLPASLSKNKPWIRKIGDIQASLSE